MTLEIGKLLKLLLLSIPFWLGGVIGLIVIGSFESPLTPKGNLLATGWMALVGLLWAVLIIRRLMKWGVLTFKW